MWKIPRATRTLTYKTVVCIAIGLAGFALNFWPINVDLEGGHRASFMIGLVFPMIVALAWGWKYGLISATVGMACQSGWFIWGIERQTLISLPPLTLWIVWHGWWADRRREDHPWRESPFAIEIPFRIVIELGFYTVFRWLVSFNPPPWNAAITWDQVPLSWVHTVAIKHTITAYILLLAAYVALSLGAVRRFFGLRPRPAQRDTTAIYAGAILMSLFIWVIDAIVDRH